MTSLKMANRRIGSLFAVAALVLATVTPGLVPAFASAAQISERSVQVSNSSADMAGVSYDINFKASATAEAVVLNFCKNTPLIETDCTFPTGFDAASAQADGFTVAKTAADVANAIVVTGNINAGDNQIVLEGIHNPSAAEPLYLRIVTYGSAASAANYLPGNLGQNAIDRGGAAISITDTVGVSGAVLESMTFCVSADQIASSCTPVDPEEEDLAAPTLRLGVTNGDVVALSSSVVSSGDLYSQLSTNAASGAVVNLQSSAKTCGGLLRFGGAAGECNIKPALADGITAGQAKFGVQVASAADPAGVAGNSVGSYRAFGGGTGYYNDSVFKLNFVTGDETGITSPYGDQFLDTAGAPVNNKNVKITFGVSAANNTAAGLYATDLNMIATGKF